MDFSKRMSMKEAAAYLGRSPHWLSVNRERYAIPGYLIGGYFYFLKEQLDSWILNQETTTKRTSRSKKQLRSQPLAPINL